jgi:thioredoxin 1
LEFIEIDDRNFDTIVEQEFKKGNIVILKFSSTLCDACQLMEFELQEVQDEMENISTLEIDAGECEALLHRFKVEQIPTTIIYKDPSKEILRKSGIILAADIIDIISQQV